VSALGASSLPKIFSFTVLPHLQEGKNATLEEYLLQGRKV
jgi:hypothetical protein